MKQFINYIAYIYGEVGTVKVCDIRPNPHLANRDAEHYEIDCPVHPQTECITINLWDVYIPSKDLWPLIGETACGKFSVWAD